jgi:hypothetical protein
VDNYAAYELLSSAVRAELQVTGTLDLRAALRKADRTRRYRPALRRALTQIAEKNPAYAKCELFQLADKLPFLKEELPPRLDPFEERPY